MRRLLAELNGAVQLLTQTKTNAAVYAGGADVKPAKQFHRLLGPI